MKFPRVIWMGTNPLNDAGKFRIVDRGPPRPERKDDVPFVVEKCVGVDSMKRRIWVQPKDSGPMQVAIWSISHALGNLLTVDPKKLDLEHPLFCEVNLAVAEGRESRGCDCDRPNDPLDKGRDQDARIQLAMTQSDLNQIKIMIDKAEPLEKQFIEGS